MKKEKKSCVAKGLLFGITYVLLVLAVVFAFIAWNAANFPSSHAVHSSSGVLQSGYSGHILASTGSAVSMTMPDNLIEYVGRTYNVDCLTPFAHSVRTTKTLTKIIS